MSMSNSASTPESQLDVEKAPEPNDWKKCAICQQNKDESLQCPAESKRQSDFGAGYKTLAENIKRMIELDCLPSIVNPVKLDEGGGIEITLMRNKARWHKSCSLQFNTTKVRRAEKRALKQEQSVGGKYTRSSATLTVSKSSEVCFICQEYGSRSNGLHNVSTLRLDARVRECAYTLQDEKLLAKLSEGDLVALEASYHASCLASLYKKANNAREKVQEDVNIQRPDGIVLAELVAFIEEQRTYSEKDLPVFRLAELATKYTMRMKQLCGDTTQRINTSRLKERILCQIPDLNAYKQGRDIYLAFRSDLAETMQRAHSTCDEDAIHLAKAASILRKDMQAMHYSFDGSFDHDCQETSVPESVVSLINMILYGPNIESQASNFGQSQASLSVSQLIQFNSYLGNRRRSGNSKRERRSKYCETPVPLYVGLSIHAKTRSRDLIETMHSLGLSVSYDRVLAISTELGNSVCRRYHEEQVVCPPNLRIGLFTTSALDNIDHNPSSTTARDSFHGTGISMFQHATPDVPGTSRSNTLIATSTTATSTSKSVGELPQPYTQVTPVTLESNVPPPDYQLQQEPATESTSNLITKENGWLQNASNIVNSSSDGAAENIQCVSWAAYHSINEQPRQSNPSAINALLPLFPDEAKSAAMIKHAMDVIKSCINYLNPGQVPVIAVDQPLYAIAKQIQWKWNNLYGESKFVVMFGGLHIEMAFLKLLGGWLERSGWTTALTDAEVASAGTANSFLKASSVTRTRRAHQVTAISLYILIQRAYAKYQEHASENGSPALSFDEWCEKQKSVPQFYYWHTTMQLQLLLLVFVRSIRTSNFKQYTDSLSKMIPWFFAMNHVNYARWLPVHLLDMRRLTQTAPNVASKFEEGFFTVQKSSRNFSCMAIDQAHEQNNAIVKGEGGAVGLTENPNALRRWMIAGPELARLVNEFEADMNREANHQMPVTSHHEVHRSFQTSFLVDVKALVNTLEELGNPFLEDSQDLIALDTKEIPGREAVSMMLKAEALGQEQSKAYISECLVNRKKSMYEPIKRNKIYLFNTPASKTSKASQKVSSLKSDCSLFSRLYISCQTRDGDLDQFFQHENQRCPPALSNLGKLRLPRNKSELVECLQSHTSPQSTIPTNVEVIIIDGAALVNMIKPGAQKTFNQYATESFLPYVKAQLSQSQRVDVVWDEYVENSLKQTTRCDRGTGVRRRVEANSQLPRSWKDFLRVDDNKRELFKFLAGHIASLETDKLVVTTYGKEVRCTAARDTNNLSPCSQEEADTRMILHLADAVEEGYHNIVIRTVDTDVLVLATAAYHNLQTDASTLELWVAFGTGTHLRYIAAHEIAIALGKERSFALPFFHAFTGCDTVSCFGGRGKKTAVETWKLYPDATDAFLALSFCPAEVSEPCMERLERFVILMYDRTSDKTDINQARKQLFAQKGRPLESIPPTRAALVQHTKRAAYQAGYCWGQAILPAPVLPSPQDWGWSMSEDGWQPFWSSLPDVTKSCMELVKCSCKKGCSGRCSCVKAQLVCTALCGCLEDCGNTE